MALLKRRTVIQGFGALLGSSAWARAGLSLGADAVDGGVKLVPARMIAEAERIFQLAYSAKEREQLSRVLETELELVRLRRTYLPSHDLPPAIRFDPRLPQTKLPTAATFRPPSHAAAPLPKNDEDIAFAPVWQLAAWIRSRALTSERLTRIYLERLRRLGPKLECVATLAEAQALSEARRCDAELARGKSRGPLHGIPYGAKDIIDTDGLRTAWGAGGFQDRVPKRDATVITRLRDAGAVLLGKLSVGELAMDDRWYGGRTRNPWFTEEGSSGSSAGSASAVAAGLAAFALGTETYGSIVSPSMRCGVTGLRPTFGRVPRGGVMALCWSLDKIGPITRCVEDTAFVLRELSGAHEDDPSSVSVPLDYNAGLGVKGLKVGYSAEWFKDGNDIDRTALEKLRGLGVQLVEVELPKLPYEAMVITLNAESAAAFEDLTLSNRDDLLVRQDDQSWPTLFRSARFLSAVDLIQADRLRRAVMSEFATLFQRVDALFSPSFASSLLLVTNFTGHPSLTLRAGFFEVSSPRGNDEVGAASPSTGPKHRVPHGVTFWGRLYDEGTLLRLGTALEGALDVWRDRPRLDGGPG